MKWLPKWLHPSWFLVLPLFLGLFSRGQVADHIRLQAGVDVLKEACLSEDWLRACDAYRDSHALHESVWISTLILLFALSFMGYLFRFLGGIRGVMSFLAMPLILFYLLLLALVICLQGIYLALTWRMLELAYFDNFNFLAAALIMGLALSGASVMLYAVFRVIRPKPVVEVAIRVKEEHDKQIYDWVSSLAQHIGTRAPDNILIGDSENFYVTTARLAISGDDNLIKGRTLFLSSPLLHVLTHEELRAVVGHELGHFKGGDTFYSRTFAPARRAMREALEGVTTHDSTNAWERARNALISPARELLLELYFRYEFAIRGISRQRELKADQIGAEIGGYRAFATSLLKVCFYQGSIRSVMKHVIRRCVNGRPVQNISQIYAGAMRWDLTVDHWHEFKSHLDQSVQSHPFDTHPTAEERLKAMGMKPSDVDHSDVEAASQDESAANLVPNLDQIEKIITDFRNHQIRKYYDCSDEPQGGDILLSVWAAHMTLADGKIERDEVKAVEEIATNMTKEFDIIDFREYCAYPDTLPALDELLEYSARLDESSRGALLSFLEAISKADGEQSPEEIHLLSRAHQQLAM